MLNESFDNKMPKPRCVLLDKIWLNNRWFLKFRMCWINFLLNYIEIFINRGDKFMISKIIILLVLNESFSLN